MELQNYIPELPKPGSNKRLFIGLGALLVVIVGVALAWYFWPSSAEPSDSNGLVMPGSSAAEPLREPTLTTAEVATGYSNIWDMVFVANSTAVFDERNGKLHGVNIDTKETWEIGVLPSVLAEGEGGLMGLAKDTEFATNKFMYACYNSTGRTRAVKVARFKLGDDFKTISDVTNIIPDIQSKAGRHSGCRMVMDQNNHLWIGTGDSAIGTAPQDPESLGGKVLRVDRDGKGVAGNASAPFDNRIYSYGHRNIQGIVLLKSPLANGAIGLTSEHGPDKQDEVNWLKPGNFGWNPDGPGNDYDESVPMTDKSKYLDAVEAVWNSGDSTIAVSGMTFLTSSRWSEWQGWAAVAALNGRQVRLLQITSDGALKAEKKILADFGRIRTAVEGPNGDLFLVTDNGRGQDKIIRVIPE